TTVYVRAGNVGFGGGGSYAQLDVAGNVVVNAPNGIATDAVVNLGVPNNSFGVLDTTGNNQTIAGLTGDVGVLTNSGTLSTLTINAASDHTYGGSVGGNLGLTKSGVAAQTLTGSLAYTGNTTVSNGRLTMATNLTT